MKRNILFVLFNIIIVTMYAGVGEPITGFPKSDFGTFFNIKETGREAVENHQTLIKYKTGGFQEFIDLQVIIDSQEIITQFELVIIREWIEQQKFFTRDLIKSYLNESASLKTKKFIEPLVNMVWDGNSNVGKDMLLAYEALEGNKPSILLKGEDCEFIFINNSENENSKPQLIIRTSLLKSRESWKMKTPVAEIFIDESFMKNYDLNKVQDEKDMKAWNHENANAKIFRVVDIRWVLENEEQAKLFHFEKLTENSENSEMVIGEELPKFGSELYIFKLNPEQEVMLENIGAEQNHFFFIFRINNIVAKVFVAGNKQLTMNEASVFGHSAAEVIEKNKD